MLRAYDTYNDQIGVRLSYVISDVEKKSPVSIGAITYGAYEKRAIRNPKLRLRNGGGVGNDVLLSWTNLPYDWQQQLIENFGDPTREARPNAVERFYSRDPKAADFYANYTRPDGKMLDAKYIREYIANASVLNALIKAESHAKGKRKGKSCGAPTLWETLVQDIEQLANNTGHTLKAPSLRRTIRKYKLVGYESLISGRLGNENRRKVTAPVERMLLSLYAMPNKPFSTSVHKLYSSFLAGNIEVVDKQTGEFFNRPDFYHNGEPIEISEQTVWNYINNPLNRAAVDKSRMDSLDYNNTHRPHARRHAPKYSFSKVSMDDRDLPRKINGGGRVKAYYSYDVASGAVVGYAYSRNKDEALFIDCLRDMFRLMDKQGWGVPMEVEVENHLVNKFFDDLNLMFPILRICAPGNSQEKHAEHFNKAKKYGVEKKTQTGIGRWWARSEAYRTKSNKVSNEYVESLYEYDTLVADDIRAVIEYNNQLHPKQKKYPGMTRWQVLCYNINPDAMQPNKALWMKSIGEHTTSSIKRSKYVTVQYNEYELPSPAIIGKLKPNNYSVDVYWLPNESGEVTEVYLYQMGEYLCKCAFSGTFNSAKAEWMADDKDTFQKQAAYAGKYDSLIKKTREAKIMKPEIITATTIKAISEVKPVAVTKKVKNDIPFDFEALALKWGGDWMEERAINDI